jgi:hypothetical protein
MTAMRHELAQFNVARPLAPLESAVMSEFMGALDKVNALAEAAPGFLWRLQDDSGNATALQPMGPGAIVNMSVWRDAASLSDFVHRSGHVDYLKRRREWFERIAEAYVVLWWVPAGHRPAVEEGVARLRTLREEGPCAEAFTFREAFAAPPADTARVAGPLR